MSELRAYPPIVFVAGLAHRVSYSASGDLYSARPAAVRARRLRAWRSLRGPGPTAADGEPYGTYTARWSPDGRRIALVLSVWYDDPYAQLAVVSSDGRRLRKLTTAGTLMTDVSWTPQGSLVVSDQNGPVLAVSMNRRSRQLGSGSDPDLAPTGGSLVAATSRGLVLYGPHSTPAHALTGSGNDVSPRWSPDGTAVAFVRQRGCYYEADCLHAANVYVVGARGGRPRRLTVDADVGGSLLWSRDARSIAFTEWKDSPNGERVPDIGLVTVDGARVRRLASNARALDWSPDGKKLLFLRSYELWVMDADGGRQTRLALNRPGLAVIDGDWSR